MPYCYIVIYSDTTIKTQEGKRMIKTQEGLLFKYIYLPLYCKGSKG